MIKQLINKSKRMEQESHPNNWNFAKSIFISRKIILPNSAHLCKCNLIQSNDFARTIHVCFFTHTVSCDIAFANYCKPITPIFETISFFYIRLLLVMLAYFLLAEIDYHENFAYSRLYANYFLEPSF